MKIIEQMSILFSNNNYCWFLIELPYQQTLANKISIVLTYHSKLQRTAFDVKFYTVPASYQICCPLFPQEAKKDLWIVHDLSDVAKENISKTLHSP